MRRLVPVAIILISTAFLCVSYQYSSAGNGEALFDSLKCGACHKPDRKTTAVSLAEIARTYQDQAKLASFFKGESQMIVESTKSGMMKGQLKHLQALSDQDKNALADYILGFK
jgi:cytochrome c551/c552